MAMVFAPADFVVDQISSKLFDALKSLPDDVVVLLEFHSPGRKKRQVDVAVCGPNGIDVLEVKNITRGTVKSNENGAWDIVEDSGGTKPMRLNTKSGKFENPYQQAKNTATDLEQGLRNIVRGSPKVFPAVIIPVGRPAARLQQCGFVNAINGVENLCQRGGLRSLGSGEDGPFSYKRRLEVANGLKLVDVGGGIAFVTGQVIDEAGDGVRGATIMVDDTEIATDEAGRFSFATIAGLRTLTVSGGALTGAYESDHSFMQGDNAPVELQVPLGAAAVESTDPDVVNLLADIARRLDSDRHDREADKAERQQLLELFTETAEGFARAREEVPTAQLRPDDIASLLCVLQEVREARVQERRGVSDALTSATIAKGMELVRALDVERAIRPAGHGRARGDITITSRAVAPTPPRPVAVRTVATPRTASTTYVTKRDPRAFRLAATVLVLSLLVVGSAVGYRALVVPTPPSGGKTTAAAPVSTPVTPLARSAPSTWTALPGTPLGNPNQPAGSGVAPLDRATCPATHPIKGNINSRRERIFHVVGQQYYDATHPAACYASDADARADGFRASLR
ncbi:MAG: NERD domain-containing protein [Gemmatimonadaceae bacterium]|nr:NERD domain-containing protein [Gemmatimonadaceae bacterium]